MRIKLRSALRRALSAAAQAGEEQVARYLDSQHDRFANVAHQIWTFAEVGCQEEKSLGAAPAAAEGRGVHHRDGHRPTAGRPWPREA